MSIVKFLALRISVFCTKTLSLFCTILHIAKAISLCYSIVRKGDTDVQVNPSKVPNATEANRSAQVRNVNETSNHLDEEVISKKKSVVREEKNQTKQ